MRLSTLLVCALLAGCPSTPAPKEQPPRDPTTEAWYGETLNELTAMNRQARELFEKGKADEAAALIEKGEPLSTRLNAVPRPALEAVEAASDLDQIYGQMLFSNKHYGWARLMFQKNAARWRNRKPQTTDTESRLHRAEAAIAECDRRMVEAPSR